MRLNQIFPEPFVQEHQTLEPPESDRQTDPDQASSGLSEPLGESTVDAIQQFQPKD